ncbi:MAG TPA: apolipoprotein N-acyltransferase [Gemmataceae bacterium]|nr:apolipoprotein N-acyltransferase [Gemmataceae bacterium]
MSEPVLAVNSASRLAQPHPFAPQPPEAVSFRLPLPRLFLALATALLLSLCHFTILPFSFGWFAWFALVPLLCLVRSEARPRRIYFAAWAGGLAFFTFVLQWMRVADWRMYFTWAMLATWCSLFVPLGVFLVRHLDRQTAFPLVVTVPAVWVGLDFLRSYLLTGFAWYFLGHTQHDFLPIIQVADLGGVYAVTLVVAAVNALFFELLYSRAGFRVAMSLPEAAVRRRLGLVVQSLAVVLLVGATLGYGYRRLHEDGFETGPRLALLQGNVPQAVRNSRHDADEESDRQSSAQTIADEYMSLHDIAERAKPDMIVWPETSFPADWKEFSREFLDDRLEELRRRYRDAGKAELAPTWEAHRQWAFQRANEGSMREIETWPMPVLLGLNSEVYSGVGASENPAKRFNSAVFFNPGGKYAGRYDKIHRVPWGEYVPLRDWIPAMNVFAPYDHEYSVASGEQMTRFALGGYHFGVLICFEDSDAYLTRQFLRGPTDRTPLDVLPQIVGGGMYAHLPAEPPPEPPVDFLVNISNDGWFDGTAEHEEHLAICRFRAVECRRSMVRAVNMGISAVIDGNGRVLAPTTTHSAANRVSVWEINRADGAADLPPNRWADFKKVAGVIVADVPLDTRASFYARWGDWLPASCWLIVGLGLCWPTRNKPGA